MTSSRTFETSLRKLAQVLYTQPPPQLSLFYSLPQSSVQICRDKPTDSSSVQRIQSNAVWGLTSLSKMHSAFYMVYILLKDFKKKNVKFCSVVFTDK